MRTEQNNQDLDRRVEQLLSPRFTPSADEIKLSKPKRPARRIWLNVLRFGAVAAVIVVGLFLMFEPTNEAVAKTSEIIAEALDALQNSDAISVDFRMKATINNNGDETEYYKCDPNGEDIEGTLTLLKSGDKEYSLTKEICVTKCGRMGNLNTIWNVVHSFSNSSSSHPWVGRRL